MRVNERAQWPTRPPRNHWDGDDDDDGRDLDVRPLCALATDRLAFHTHAHSGVHACRFNERERTTQSIGLANLQSQECSFYISYI